MTTYPFSALQQVWPNAASITEPPDTTKGDVVIGNDVWIATRATILSGVTIGDGAVVAAGAIVVDDVEPYAIVAGNPARLVKRRFTEAEIAVLLKVRWWDWPDDQVHQHLQVLCNDDVAAIEALGSE